MPHYFVEGWRDGKPMPALYIQADNPDAAVARAAQLKMQEVTGVRLAKPMMSLPHSPRLGLLFFLPIGLRVVMHGFRWSSEGGSFPAEIAILLFLIAAIVIMYHFLSKAQQKLLKMQSETVELRKKLESREENDC